MTAPDHTTCAETLRTMFAGRGIEVTVSRKPPLVVGPYTTDAHRCPHRVKFWAEPTGEQIAQWAKDGVE